jgi:hypothetical protein
VLSFAFEAVKQPMTLIGFKSATASSPMWSTMGYMPRRYHLNDDGRFVSTHARNCSANSLTVLFLVVGIFPAICL